jgi:hypothetical protein
VGVRLGAAGYQELGELLQVVGAGAVEFQFFQGFGFEVGGDVAGDFEAMEGGVGGFVLGLVFAGGFAQGGGRFFDVENVVNDLKGPADIFAEIHEATEVVAIGAAGDSSGDDGGANERTGFGAVNIFEHAFVAGFTFSFEVGNLAADHAAIGADGFGDHSEDSKAALGLDGRHGESLEGESEQGIAGEDRGSFAENFVVGGLTATQIVVVEGGEIIVNQRISVNQFESAADFDGSIGLRRKDSRGFQTEDGANAFAAGENAVTHSGVNGNGQGGFAGEYFLQGGIDQYAISFEEFGSSSHG